MANEVRVTSSLQIRNGKGLEYRSTKTTFVADMTNNKGPSPGAVTVTTTGGAIDLSALTRPRWADIWNIEDPDTSSNLYVDIGIREPVTGYFYPIISLEPGQGIDGLPLSFNLLEEWWGATGTSAANNQLYARAVGANAVVNFSVFDM